MYYQILYTRLKTQVEEGLVTDDRDMAGILNQQYCSVFTRENTADMPESERLYMGLRLCLTCHFRRKFLCKKLKNLNTTAAPDTDGV